MIPEKKIFSLEIVQSRHDELQGVSEQVGWKLEHEGENHRYAAVVRPLRMYDFNTLREIVKYWYRDREIDIIETAGGSLSREDFYKKLSELMRKQSREFIRTKFRLNKAETTSS